MSERHPRRSADVEAILSDMDANDLELLDPPDEVWEGIAAATAASDAASPAKLAQLQSRRRIPRHIAVISVAAALAAIAAVSTYFALQQDDSDQVLSTADSTLQEEPEQVLQDEPVPVLSTAELTYDAVAFDPLGADASAKAELVEAEAGYVIDLAGAKLPNPEAGADLEVWLIQPDAAGGVADLVSLGMVDPANPGRLDVPASHDPDIYFVVDISVEPRDGNPDHSGRSILRGPLQDS